MSLKLSYGLLAIVVAVALFVGTRPDHTETPDERVASLEHQIKCPICRGESVAESDTEAAKAIRTEVARRVDDGQSDGEIRAYFAQTLGPDILLRPASSGFGGLVWVLPVAAFVAAGAGLGYAFWRWRRWA
jgi:cytochrome c-type biogenesis protein CcmH